MELYCQWRNELQSLPEDEKVSGILSRVNHGNLFFFCYFCLYSNIFQEFDGYGRGAILSISVLVFLCFHVYTDDSIPSLSITVNSQLQSGGLGSSAAFSVALSAVLLTDSGLITLGQDQNDFNSENKNTINNLAR